MEESKLPSRFEVIEAYNELKKEKDRYWKALDHILLEYQVGNANPSEMFKIAKNALGK